MGMPIILTSGMGISWHAHYGKLSVPGITGIARLPKCSILGIVGIANARFFANGRAKAGTGMPFTITTTHRFYQ